MEEVLSLLKDITDLNFLICDSFKLGEISNADDESEIIELSGYIMAFSVYKSTESNASDFGLTSDPAGQDDFLTR